MATMKISSKVEEQPWIDLKLLAAESHQTVSGLLTEAITEYVSRRRVRPQVMAHLQDSMEQNAALGELLAR